MKKTTRKKLITTIIILVASLLLLSAAAKMALDFKRRLDFARQNIILIEGEIPKESNYAERIGRIYKNNALLNGKGLELSTSESIEGGYYLIYEFEIEKSGIYNIIVCGTPPGPLQKGSKWHSLYSIIVDGKIGKILSEELITEEWPQYKKYNYLEGGYFFTKILTVDLDKGLHKINININQRRKHDGNFTFYIDAIIISPEGFRPQVRIGKIPKELFYDL
jgi:hypothetical protein